MNKPVISNSLIHFLTVFITILCLSSWSSAHSINIDPGAYQGRWAPPGGVLTQGSAEVELTTGNHIIRVGERGNFEINVDENGAVTVINGISATGGQKILNFNATDFRVETNGYQGRLTIGFGPELGRSTGEPNESLSAALVPGLDYSLSIAYHSNFRISIDGVGNVTSENLAAASASGNTLSLNTTTLDVEPNGYMGLLRVADGPDFGRSTGESGEILSRLIVPGLSYSFGVALYSDFRINIDENGYVTSDSIVAATTSGNTLSLNITTLNVDRNGYEGYLNIGLGPVLGWPSTEISSIQVVPGLSYSFGVALYSDFRINIDVTGNVTSDSAAAATTSGNTLSLNTVRFNVEANDYTGSWRIVNGPGPKTGSDSVLIVPHGGKYTFAASNVQEYIYVPQDCVVDPSDILVDGVTLNLSIACAPQYHCSGFESPMDQGPVTVKKNRALPLKAQLLDENGSLTTDADIVALPVIQVLYNSGTGGEPIDVTDDALSAGEGTEGNQFVFTDEGKWQYNLKTKNYTAEGTYNITISTGDDSEYVINPTCEASFIIK